ncbi:hypothetical protein ACFLZN_01600 [Nanoarchaeota archaeon]
MARKKFVSLGNHLNLYLDSGDSVLFCGHHDLYWSDRTSLSEIIKRTVPALIVDPEGHDWTSKIKLSRAYKGPRGHTVYGPSSKKIHIPKGEIISAEPRELYLNLNNQEQRNILRKLQARQKAFPLERKVILFDGFEGCSEEGLPVMERVSRPTKYDVHSLFLKNLNI